MGNVKQQISALGGSSGSSGLPTKFKWWAGVVAAIFLLIFVKSFFLGFNTEQNWQIRQSVGGEITIQDRGGWYGHLFNTIWTYPRAINKQYKGSSTYTEDTLRCTGESIRVTFNDGGNACIDTLVRFKLPTNALVRKNLHREYSGSVEAINLSVFAHIRNVAKTTAPLMSASEHQSARKGEFRELAAEQLKKGLFKMKKVERILKDRTDENGKAITVFATELVLNEDGMPIVIESSPLLQYGIEVLQFSIGSTDYDPQTLTAFKTKKDSFLKAESFKSQRESEVQQRLMVEEQGKRQKAEVEANSLKEKAKAVIEAQKKKEVAELEASQKVAVEQQAKLEAQTKAQKQLEVERIEKIKAQTIAAKKLEVAKLNAKAAARNAEAIRVLAKAEEERIRLAGAITERDKVLAEIQANRDVEIADRLSNVKVPQWLIVGGGQGSNGTSNGPELTNTLMNLLLLKSAGNATKIGNDINTDVNVDVKGK